MQRRGGRAVVTTLTAAWLAACGGEGGAGSSALPAPEVTDSAGVQIVDNRLPQGPVPRYATLSEDPVQSWPEPSEPSPYGLRRSMDAAVTLQDGRVAVADAGTLRLRWYRGEDVEATFGQRGEGEGGFRELSAMGPARGDTVWVHDARSGVLSLVGPPPRPREIRSAPVPGGGSVVGRFGDASLLVRLPRTVARGESPPAGISRDTVPWLRWWPQTGDTATVGRFPTDEILALDVGGDAPELLPPPLARRTSQAVGPGRFYVGAQDAFAIRAYDPDGSLRQIVRVPDFELRVDPSSLTRYDLRDATGRIPDWADAYWSHARDTRPAYGRLLLDGRGNLWVAEHVITDEPARNWLVFTPDGALAGLVEVPRDFRILEIGADHVLGERRAPSLPGTLERYRLERRGR